MITLMNASAARKESELNMKFAAAKQWEEEIESAIHAAVRARKFEVQFEKSYMKKMLTNLKN